MKTIIISIFCAVALVFLLTVTACNQSPFLSEEQYCEKILSLAETQTEIAMADVFQFEFDKAYISHPDEAYADEEYFVEKLKVKDTIAIRLFEHENSGRILFVKDDAIIYDFVCFHPQLLIKIFTENGVWVSPETAWEVTKGTRWADLLCVDEIDETGDGSLNTKGRFLVLTKTGQEG